MKTKEITRYFVFGLCAGVGLSIGWQISEYLIRVGIRAAQGSVEKSITKNVEKLDITYKRLVRTRHQYQVTAKIKNNDVITYYDVVVKARLNDEKGLLDVADEISLISLEPGEEYDLSFNFKVYAKDYPSAELGKVEVIAAKAEKKT